MSDSRLKVEELRKKVLEAEAMLQRTSNGTGKLVIVIDCKDGVRRSAIAYPVPART